MDKKIFVTQPHMPPLEEYVEFLKQIWESKWITKRIRCSAEENLGFDNWCLLAVAYFVTVAVGENSAATEHHDAISDLERTGEVVSDHHRGNLQMFLKLANPTSDAAKVLRKLNVQVKDAEGNFSAQVDQRPLSDDVQRHGRA